MGFIFSGFPRHWKELKSHELPWEIGISNLLKPGVKSFSLLSLIWEDMSEGCYPTESRSSCSPSLQGSGISLVEHSNRAGVNSPKYAINFLSKNKQNIWDHHFTDSGELDTTCFQLLCLTGEWRNLIYGLHIYYRWPLLGSLLWTSASNN